MARVLRTKRARVDLLEIWLYIAKDSPVAADRLMDRIDAICNTLAAQPLTGQAPLGACPGLAQHYRR